MKFKKWEVFALILIIVIESLIFIPSALNKIYIHIDEAEAFGHASHNTPLISDNKDFFDTWHNKEYYDEYLSLNDGENSIIDVYKNQMETIDPPLYYMLLRVSMNITKGEFSILPGVIINMIAYIGITILLYLIVRRLFVNEKYSRVKSLIVTFMSCVTLASLSNVIFTGTYSLLTLEVIAIAYIHIRLLEKKKATFSLLLPLFIVICLSLLTSYYSLLFIIPLYIIYIMRYVSAKDKKSRRLYNITVLSSALLSVVLFPFAIINIIFGDLGGEIIGTLGIQTSLIRTFIDYIQKLDHFGFNNMLIVIGIAALVCIIVKMRKPAVENENTDTEAIAERKMLIKTLLIPSIAYFICVIIVSSWTELRYIAPVCAILFVLTIYGIYKLFINAFNIKVSCIAMAVLFVAMAVYPFISHSYPECTYRDKAELLEKVEDDYNIPAIYILNTEDNRFLDDILLFTRIDESYVVGDYDVLSDNVNFASVLENKDTKDGILVFINKGQATKHILDNMLTYTDFDGYESFAVLNSGEIFYFGYGIECEEISESVEDELLTSETTK